MAKIIGVKFKDSGKLYYFAPGSGEYAEGSGVIVETARGVEYATVCVPLKEVPDEELVAPLKPVLRAATQKDEETISTVMERGRKALLDTVGKCEKEGTWKGERQGYESVLKQVVSLRAYQMRNRLPENSLRS